LLNRVTQGLYAPGSVYKVINVAAGLQSGLFNRESTYVCDGYWRELGETFIKRDWTVDKDKPPHGQIILPQALTYSCNPYNYHIGFELFNLDPEYLSKISRDFGLGKPTGVIGLLEGTNEEVGGIVPDAAWKQQNVGELWTAGDHVNMAIGQGYLQVTTMQMAAVYAALGNGGTLYRPQLVEKIQPVSGDPVSVFRPEATGTLPVSPENLAIIQEAMRSVVDNSRGTAYARLGNFSIPVAAKTGTAESGAADPHAWFAGYSMLNNPDKPDIAVVVLVNYLGEGSIWAAPIFRRVMEIYFFGNPQTVYLWEETFGIIRPPDTETENP
jgi:penicillin-binding protein 2